MMLYNEKEPLYLGTDVSGAGLGVGQLQVKEGMIWPREKTPDNAILRPKAFVSNSLSSAETCYSNKEKHWVFCMASKNPITTPLQDNHYRQQAPCHHIQERYSNIIKETVVHLIEDTSRQMT